LIKLNGILKFPFHFQTSLQSGNQMSEEPSKVESLLLRGDYAACAALCRPVLEAGLDVSKAKTTSLEIEPHRRQEVPRYVKELGFVHF